MFSPKLLKLLLLLLLLLITVVPVSSQDTPPIPQTVDLSQLKLPTKEASYPFMTIDVSRLYTRWLTGGREGVRADTLFESRAEGEQVHIMFVMVDEASVPAVVTAINAAGGEVSAQYKRWLNAWVPVSQLPGLAQTAGVSVVQNVERTEPIPAPVGKTPMFAPGLDGLALPLAPVEGTIIENDPTASSTDQLAPRALSASFVSITQNVCKLTVTFKTNGVGNYYLDIWDDGTRLLHKLFIATVTPQTFTYTYAIRKVSPMMAEGYAINVRDSFNNVLVTDNDYDVSNAVLKHCANRVKSEGVTYSGANLWHQAGWLGDGATVSILDYFAYFTSAQTLGALPPDILTYGTLDYSSAHGTAVAEIVYDMAPGAQLIFASPQNSVEMASTIANLASYSHVIQSSIGFYDSTPGDGTGAVAEAIRFAEDHNTLYVQAAGNQARYNWQSYYADANGNSAYDFSMGDEINMLNKGSPIPANTYVDLHLRWNGWSTTDQDYDLLLMYWTGSSWAIICSSSGFQTGTQPPTEHISCVVPYNGIYGILINKYSATGTQVLDLMGHNQYPFEHTMKDLSLVDAAAAWEAMSVGAVQKTATNYALTSYSSRGPSMGDGGMLWGGAPQPRISAYTAVSTWTYGTGGFSGTSSAAPHVAGAAALVISSNPWMTMVQVKGLLEGRSVDMGPAGYDYGYGAGRLNMGAAPVLIPPMPVYPASGQQLAALPVIEWSYTPRATKYELQIASTCSFTKIREKATTESLGYVPSRLYNRTWCWRVRGINTGGIAGQWSTPMSFTLSLP